MKGKTGQVRRQLLRKDSDEVSKISYELPSLEIQFDGDCPSEIWQKDRSYYQLNEDAVKVNPYPFEPSFEDRSNSRPEPKKSPQPKAEQPREIAMNGNCYRKVEVKNQKIPQKKKVQEMHVICCKCYTSQIVPGNSKKFYCYSCQNLNQCQPKYKYFRCGKCKVKVCYQWGISEYIKCSACQTVNLVPAH